MSTSRAGERAASATPSPIANISEEDLAAIARIVVRATRPEVQKLVREEAEASLTPSLKSQSHVEQYKINADVIAVLRNAKRLLKNAGVHEVCEDGYELVKDAIDKLHGRNEEIVVADSTPGKWGTVAILRQLRDVTSYPKRQKEIQRASEQACKEREKAQQLASASRKQLAQPFAAPKRFHPYVGRQHFIRGGGALYQQRGRFLANASRGMAATGQFGSCFDCGLFDHWRGDDACPTKPFAGASSSLGYSGTDANARSGRGGYGSRGFGGRGRRSF